ncbi:chondroadherin-like [Periplaneta americana]|uniref:chondroadherin-like n=1 Tax=Periplaneta americana TaxID=6978 RepID=UPI0037E75E1A
MLRRGMEDEQPSQGTGGLPLLPSDGVDTTQTWKTMTRKSLNHSQTAMTPNIVRKIASKCWKWLSKLRGYGQQHSTPLISASTKKRRPRVVAGSSMALVHVLLFLLLLGGGDALCPSRCSCNDETLRASCEDAALEVVPIQLNPDVKIINLRDNRIGDVHFTLGFYSNLRALDVSRNRISSLGSKNFELQEKLVSLNASGNQITNLSKFTFSGLRSLQVLDLSGNLIESLEGGVWEDSPNLWEMYLRSNKIITIGEGVFDPLINLKVLDLSDNQLLDVPTGALRRLPSLRTLNLGENLIESVSDDAIPNLRDLKSLSLESNVISFIHDAAFDGLLSLEYLDVSYNNLSLVPKQQLSKLTCLKELDLSGNQFTSLGPIAFQSLFELRRLRLNRLPRLEQVDVRAFVDNINLQRVFMEYNVGLTNLPTRLFHGNPLLVDVSVRGNSFTILDASHFPLDHMDSLLLAGNPLYCNCSMLWLWVLARKQYETERINVTLLPQPTDASPTASITSTKEPNKILHLDIDAIRCAGPETVKKLLLVDVPEEEVRCDISWLAVIIVTIVVLTLFIVMCGFLLFLGSDKLCKKPETLTDLPSHHLHHHHQNGAVLMLMPKKDNMDGLDDFMLKTKDPMMNDMQYHHHQHALATWDSISKDSVVPDNRSLGMYQNQYSVNGEQQKPTHIVYV